MCIRDRGKLNLKELAAPIAALTDPMRYDMARKDLEQQLSDDSKGWKILRLSLIHIFSLRELLFCRKISIVVE